MNKNMTIWLIIVVAIIIIGGFVAYMMMGKPSNSALQLGTNTVANQPTTSSQTLKELLASNQPQTCHFSDDSGSSGTVYIGNGSVRTDFSSTASGQAMSGHTIISGDTAYTWIDGQSTGFKTKISANQAATNTNTSNGQPFDPNKKANYTCEPWSVDASLFTIPNTITFTDIQAMIPTPSAAPTPAANVNTNSSATTNSDKCAICNSVPASYKAQCLTAYGCK